MRLPSKPRRHREAEAKARTFARWWARSPADAFRWLLMARYEAERAKARKLATAEHSVSLAVWNLMKSVKRGLFGLTAGRAA